jgi:hypothetical protein
MRRTLGVLVAIGGLILGLFVTPVYAATASQGDVAAQGTVPLVALKGTGNITTFAQINSECPNAGYICVSDAHLDGAAISTSLHHSKWLNFDALVGFQPINFSNHSNSSMWVHNEQIEYTACISPGDGTGIRTLPYQVGWLFIQYNVSGCSGNPPAGMP